MSDEGGSAPRVFWRVIRSRWFLVVFSAIWLSVFVYVAQSDSHWAWKVLATLALAIVAPGLQEVIEDFRESPGRKARMSKRLKK